MKRGRKAQISANEDLSANKDEVFSGLKLRDVLMSCADLQQVLSLRV